MSNKQIKDAPPAEDSPQDVGDDAATPVITPEMAAALAAPRTRSPEDLDAEERGALSRAYHQLRTAKEPGDAAEARERIRKILGPDAEIGDHVVILANGEVHRTEYGGTTKHNGVPVISAYESLL